MVKCWGFCCSLDSFWVWRLPLISKIERQYSKKNMRSNYTYIYRTPGKIKRTLLYYRILNKLLTWIVLFFFSKKVVPISRYLDGTYYLLNIKKNNTINAGANTIYQNYLGILSNPISTRNSLNLWSTTTYKSLKSHFNQKHPTLCWLCKSPIEPLKISPSHLSILVGWKPFPYYGLSSSPINTITYLV